MCVFLTYDSYLDSRPPRTDVSYTSWLRNLRIRKGKNPEKKGFENVYVRMKSLAKIWYKGKNMVNLEWIKLTKVDLLIYLDNHYMRLWTFMK